MSELICAVDGCERLVTRAPGRGFCWMHYQRFMKTGTTDRPGREGEQPCIVEGCDRLRHSHGLCSTHRSQLRRNGDFSEVRSTATAEERFWSAVTKTDSCWLFAKLAPTGYGYFSANGKPYPAHRFAYELLAGPIPDGLEIDHLCKTRACVNPAHLEPVLRVVNWWRSTCVSAVNARKTECLRGHPFSDENTYYSKDGRRYCIACRRLRESERKVSRG